MDHGLILEHLGIAFTVLSMAVPDLIRRFFRHKELMAGKRKSEDTGD
jgi:hypothetical protein